MLCRRIVGCRICGRLRDRLPRIKTGRTAKVQLRRTPEKANPCLRKLLPFRGNTTPVRGMLRLRAWGKSLWMAEAGMARTGSAEASGDAAVAVADAAMDAAMAVVMDETRDEAKRETMGVSAARSRGLLGLRWRALPRRLLRVRRNQAGRSSSDRQRDISRSCFRANRSRNTAD